MNLYAQKHKISNNVSTYWASKEHEPCDHAKSDTTFCKERATCKFVGSSVDKLEKFQDLTNT